MDRLARRYRKLPTEILKLSLDEWSLNVAIAHAGNEQDARDAKQR